MLPEKGVARHLGEGDGPVEIHTSERPTTSVLSGAFQSNLPGQSVQSGWSNRPTSGTAWLLALIRHHYVEKFPEMAE